jgi:hypothetical protein
MGRWAIGIISESITSAGGSTIHKGTKVKYARLKRYPDEDGFKMTDYEWHYQPVEYRDYIRTTKRIIEGLPIINEPYTR